jgi:hypothetical protein
MVLPMWQIVGNVWKIFFTLITCDITMYLCNYFIYILVGTLSTVIFYEPSQEGMDNEVDWWG